jgi:membrane protease YdiL (CAAX protease family)
VTPSRLTFPQNPWPETGLPPVPEAPGPLAATPADDPLWNGWDVLGIALLTFFSFLFFPLVVIFAAHRFLYHELSWNAVLQKPPLSLFAEFLAYLVLFFYMLVLVEGKYHERFFRAIHWNWPGGTPVPLVGLGAILLIGLQVLAHFLPIPKTVPMDQFFQTPLDAYLTSIFAISLGPFMEELFFRGFLYPVLARRLGVTVAILLTGVAFASIHAVQLGFAWGAVLIIFLVGITLTGVRAVTGSVGSSFLVHVSYNLTLTVLTFAGTAGFRHMERLNQ